MPRWSTLRSFLEVDQVWALLDAAALRERRIVVYRPVCVPGNGKPLVPSNIRQRVLAKVVAEANELLRERGIPEILECTPHTLRRTYISLLLAAGCDPAYVQQQVGHTDPTLTLRIYQQLLKRKRREEYRDRVNELLGTSPAALPRLPDLAGDAMLGPKSGPNSLLQTA